MASQKKKTATKTSAKFRDLKSKKNLKGGSFSLGAVPTKITSKVPLGTSQWIEIDSFQFGP